MATRKTKASTKQRIKCFQEALPDFLKSAADYKHSNKGGKLSQK